MKFANPLHANLAAIHAREAAKAREVVHLRVDWLAGSPPDDRAICAASDGRRIYFPFGVTCITCLEMAKDVK